MIDCKTFFDFTKLPTKIFVVIMIVSGAYLFSPDTIAEQLHLKKLEEFSGCLGLVFLFSSAFVIINFIIWIYQSIMQRSEVNKFKRELEIVVKNLDPKEKDILREFYIQYRNTLEMPENDPVVIGLVTKGVLQNLSIIKGGFLIHKGNITVAINKYADAFLTAEHLELKRDMTEDEKSEIKRRRPNWVNNGRI